MRPPKVEVSLPLLGKDYGIEREYDLTFQRQITFIIHFYLYDSVFFIVEKLYRNIVSYCLYHFNYVLVNVIVEFYIFIKRSGIYQVCPFVTDFESCIYRFFPRVINDIRLDIE